MRNLLASIIVCLDQNIEIVPRTIKKKYISDHVSLKYKKIDFKERPNISFLSGKQYYIYSIY
jgi:hypothetical protein